MSPKLQFKDLKKNQKHWYSGKKKKHTIKAQVLVNQRTLKILATNFEKGRRHDFRVYKESNLTIHPEIQIKADTAYKSKKYPSIQTPHKKPRKSKNNPNPKLTKQEKQENKQFNSVRVRIENVFAWLKKYKMIHETYRNRRKRFGLRFNLISAIYNFELDL